MKTRTERCPLFSSIKPGLKETCANCLKWTGKQCRDKGRFKENYEDTAQFKAWDRMMRSNRGVTMG